MGNFDIAKFLVSVGADPKAKDNVSYLSIQSLQ